jgi:3'-phosphoadenosine 5'-phosphosulfate sulfotransferase (PAPS reductase)/FAD synthetase
MIPRDAQGILHVVALSGGKDSTCQAVLLKEREPRPYVYVCTPTGDELPELFAHWRSLGDLLGSRLIPIIGGTLGGEISRYGSLPNRRRALSGLARCQGC